MNVTELQPGRELDRIVAEQLMGGYWVDHVLCGPGARGCWGSLERDGSFVPTVSLPLFSTSIHAAWAVVERLVEQGAKVSVHNRAVGPWACWIATGIGTPNELTQFETAETPALAICLAALSDPTPPFSIVSAPVPAPVEIQS